MKKYPCPLAKDGVCEYGGGKRFNYGFSSGVGSFCRHKKEQRFIGWMKSCPLEREDKPEESKESAGQQ